MPLTPAKCTNCGSLIEVDSAIDAAICPSCNTPYVVEKAINYFLSTYNINVAPVNTPETGADALFRDAQTLIELEAYEDASKKYGQMRESFPSDSRGWTENIRLAVEHHTALHWENVQPNPMKVALKLGDKEFLNWLYQNFDKDEQVIRAGVSYIRDVGSEAADAIFLDCLNQYFEKKCQRIRSGESNIEQEFGKESFDIKWDSGNQQLKLYCDCIPSVKALLGEAKENISYINSWVNKIGIRSYHNVAQAVIKQLWAPKWCDRDYSSTLSIFPLSGGLIGKTYYCEYDGSAGPVERFYDLGKVITYEEIDKLFQEIIRRCSELGICPCGGKKGFFSNKCSNCGRPI